MSFVTTCIQDSLPVWEECLRTPFLTHMANGTLPAECFIGYLVDDSLYLREYARVFAWGMIHADAMEEIRALYSMLSFVNESEDATRLQYLKHFSISDEMIQPLPLRPENQAYVDTMISAARTGTGVIECMMACLPCMLSYFWIFTELRARTPDGIPAFYQPLVNDYTSKPYEAVCRKWIEFTDALCENLTSEQKTRCMRIFRTCSEHELSFWQMSFEPRNDL